MGVCWRHDGELRNGGRFVRVVVGRKSEKVEETKRTGFRAVARQKAEQLSSITTYSLSVTFEPA